MTRPQAQPDGFANCRVSTHPRVRNMAFRASPTEQISHAMPKSFGPFYTRVKTGKVSYVRKGSSGYRKTIILRMNGRRQAALAVLCPQECGGLQSHKSDGDTRKVCAQMNKRLGAKIMGPYSTTRVYRAKHGRSRNPRKTQRLSRD